MIPRYLYASAFAWIVQYYEFALNFGQFSLLLVEGPEECKCLCLYTIVVDINIEWHELVGFVKSRKRSLVLALV